MMSTLPAIHVSVQSCLGAPTSHHHLLQSYFHQIVLELKWFILVVFLGSLEVGKSTAGIACDRHGQIFSRGTKYIGLQGDASGSDPPTQLLNPRVWLCKSLTSQKNPIACFTQLIDVAIKVEWRYVWIWDCAPNVVTVIIIPWQHITLHVFPDSLVCHHQMVLSPVETWTTDRQTSNGKPRTRTFARFAGRNP